MTLSLTFLGAAGTVTGSKYLLELGDHRLLVDCGLFQGYKPLRLRNWARFPVNPKSIDAVVLTHAHLDHTGYLPLLAKQGFHGPIFASASTTDLCGILLPDSGHLQENDAELANRGGYSRHAPALPLYTEDDARKVMRQFRPIAFEAEHKLPGGASVRLRRAGHILGAASVELAWNGVTTLFSGDLGRYDDPVLPDPQPIEHADYLVVESTYGDRDHEGRNPQDALHEVITRTIAGGGTVVIPAFAVGRVQSLLYHLGELKAAGRIPQALPIYVDSPMAVEASEVFARHMDDHKVPLAACNPLCPGTTYVREFQESRKLMGDPTPKVIVSASGMATGGRVLGHLKHCAPDARNTILFVGFQAGGTRGAAMVGGARSVRINGQDVAVRASVQNLGMLSAHADRGELMRWLRTAPAVPRRTYVVHGEAAAAAALRVRVEEQLRWSCVVPEQLQRVELA